jgi:4-hydroxybenzoate polyprenyltransferase
MPAIQTNVIRFINWLLYSNIFIALCALAITAQSLFLLDIRRGVVPVSTDVLFYGALLGLVFFATWFIYALHRLVSWRKLNARLDIPRFQIIGAYQSHIKLYATAAAIGAAGCFFYLEWITQLALLLPALLSLGYVLPFLGKRQLRLRDLHFVKIFLIAGVWGYVTVLLPWLETTSKKAIIEPLPWGLFLERSLFIFIITLPFDLRDWELDVHHAVKTIPTALGPRRTIQLGLSLLLLWMLLITVLYAWPLGIAYYTTALWTALLLWKTLRLENGRYKVVQQDYYYTGLIDGTLLVQAGLVLVYSS